MRAKDIGTVRQLNQEMAEKMRKVCEARTWLFCKEVFVDKMKKIILVFCCFFIFTCHPNICLSKVPQIAPRIIKKTRFFKPRKVKKKRSGYFYQQAISVMTSKGDNPDYYKAVKLLRKAAEQGHAKAQYNLGLRYLLGQGVTRDYAKAVKWLEKSATQGVTDAQYSLAMRYELGQGVEKNLGIAYDLFYKAAHKGHSDALVQTVHLQALAGNMTAQYYLAVMYNSGDKVEKDLKKAAFWYQKAARQGHVEAQLNLGALYATGSGVPQNLVTAYAWTHLAADAGNKTAQKNCSQARKEMSSDEIAKAVELASTLQD